MLKFYQLTQLDATVFGNDFVNTKTRADELHSYLTAQGLKVAKIHGDIAPRERKRIVNQGEKSGFWSTLSQQTWQRVGLTLKVSVPCHQ